MAFGFAGVQAPEVRDSRGPPHGRGHRRTHRRADGCYRDRLGCVHREAVELRDGNPSRSSRGGVLTAVGNVNTEIRDILTSRSWESLGEADHDGWQRFTARLGARIQLVGDDNFCTNPALIAAAIEDTIASAALITLNQFGSVSETIEVMSVCRRAGYGQMVSHRSGQTPDPFIAGPPYGPPARSLASTLGQWPRREPA
jgi:enolase